jgi:hypothetical protein
MEGRCVWCNEKDENLKDMARSIYVMHMPPSDLGLDHCSDGRQDFGEFPSAVLLAAGESSRRRCGRRRVASPG